LIVPLAEEEKYLESREVKISRFLFTYLGILRGLLSFPGRKRPWLALELLLPLVLPIVRISTGFKSDAHSSILIYPATKNPLRKLGDMLSRRSIHP